MQTSDLALLAFTASNSLRIFAYVPQIVSAARDRNGCSAISCSTWVMFLVAHISAVAYAMNIRDFNMAIVFGGNVACCLMILLIVLFKRQGFSRTQSAGVAALISSPATMAAAAGSTVTEPASEDRGKQHTTQTTRPLLGANIYRAVT